MSSKPASAAANPSPKADGDKKNKGGRPKKEEAEQQKNVVRVRFTQARYEQLKAHASKKGQTVAGVVKRWMNRGGGVALTAEQHLCVRSLPDIKNSLGTIAALLQQEPGRADQVAELVVLQEQLVQLLTSFQQ
jgi:hypothetical protein